MCKHGIACASVGCVRAVFREAYPAISDEELEFLEGVST
jgi:hypothetical protein